METQIPVFDLSTSSPGLADDIVAAAGKYGFLFIKSTGLDFTADDVNGTFSLAQGFFASPQAEKESCPIQHNNRGWTSMGGEILDAATQKQGDPKEAFNFGEFDSNGKAQQPLPPAFQGHEPELSRFSSLCRGLCLRLLRLFAVGLKIEQEPSAKIKAGDDTTIDEEWFASHHDPARGESGTVLRLLRYPASHGQAAIRAGAHSDYGSMTLLFRLPGQPGLEVMTPEGSWEAVPVQPTGTEQDPFPPVLVNIGDLLSYWTNGLLKSTIHRVVGGDSIHGAKANGNGNKDSSVETDARDRYSIAFFCHPSRDTALVPVPSEMVKEKARALSGMNGANGNGNTTNENGTNGTNGVNGANGANGANAIKIGYGSGAGDLSYVGANGHTLTADEHLHRRLAATYEWGKEGVAA